MQCSCSSSWPWQMGAGHDVGLQRKCGSAELCMRSSAVTLALHGGLPCLGSGEVSVEATDESSHLRRARGGSKLGLAKQTKRSSKRRVSRREKPKTGQLVFLLLFRFFTCPHFYGARRLALTGRIAGTVVNVEVVVLGGSSQRRLAMWPSAVHYTRTAKFRVLLGL